MNAYPDPSAAAAATPAQPEQPSAPESAADGLPAGANPFDLALTELRGRRDGLRQEITALEQQRDRILQEIATNPVGQSELIAKRVKGFQA